MAQICGDALTLTTRLSLFFWTTLAVVLLGFSAVLYLLVRSHLDWKSDERLASALSTLAAAAEVGPDGVVWDLAERRLSFGPATSEDQVVWIVRDEHGQIVDRASHLETADLLVGLAGNDSASLATGQVLWQGQPWRFRQTVVRSPNSELADLAVEAAGQPDEDRKYSALSLIAGVSLEPMRATLGKLAGTLTGLSLGIWLMALLAGRAICGRALGPVRRMAAAAREMDGADFCERLPSVASGDELEDLATAFNSLLSRQQASLERERRFTGDASHQLRTPLAAILGQIEVALRRERPPDEYERVLTTVHSKALHLQHIVESLLFLARAQSDALPPERVRVDLAQWVPQHLQTWCAHERYNNIAFESSEGGVLGVEVQLVLLGELVNTLLDNASKYSPPGTRITVRLFRHEQAACLQVEDHGPGIAEADLLHLFTPFFRSADVRRRKIDGVGLGLSIAKRLAESLDGEIAVTNRVGVGTCFTLRLPVVLMTSEPKADGVADRAEVGSK